MKTDDVDEVVSTRNRVVSTGVDEMETAVIVPILTHNDAL